jgi:hypothetical protein
MKHKRSLISVAMVTIMVVSLCAVCASPLTVRAADSSSANVQSALVGAPAGIAGAPAVCKPYVYGNYIALFVRGNDGALWWTNWKGATWSAWESLGGYLTSDPAVTTPDYDFMTVSVRGGDGALYVIETSDGGASWGVWYSWGGQMLAGTGPTVCSWVTLVDSTFTNRYAWFVTGTDHVLWWRTTMQGWQSLGGYLTSSPAAAALPTLDFTGNSIDVFVRGGDGALWQRTYGNNAWSGWKGLGGQLASGTGPATDAGRISVYQIGRLDVFVEGTDAGLWHRVKIGTWSGWQSLGGKLTSSPGAADVNLNFGSQQIDVFVRGTDAGLWQKYYVVATNQWSGWRGM